jgi:hypothetical protein
LQINKQKKGKLFHCGYEKAFWKGPDTMNISAPVGREVVGVSFSFYSTEEIKRLSVKAINNPITLDPVTSQPISGGLYDAALGPVDKNTQ